MLAREIWSVWKHSVYFLTPPPSHLFIWMSCIIISHFLSLLFLVDVFSLLPPSPLNRIAYRRVIRVYQYEVCDDLSGRSLSPPPLLLFFFICLLLPPPTPSSNPPPHPPTPTHLHAPSGLCDVVHLSLFSILTLTPTNVAWWHSKPCTWLHRAPLDIPPLSRSG